MPRTVQFEGREISVPDDATDDEVAQILATPPADAPSQPTEVSPLTVTAPQPAAPAAKKPNVLADTAGGFLSGIPRGLVETIMLPVTAKRMAESGVDWLVDKGTGAVRAGLGMPPLEEAPSVTAARQRQAHGPDLSSALDHAQDAVRHGMDSVLYKPQTMPGRFAETIGEFVGPGGLPSKSVRAAPTFARKAAEYAADLTRGAVAPGVASEALGEATSGTKYEPAARVLGAMAGNVAAGVGKSAVAPEVVLRRAAGDISDADWQRAIGLQNNTTGVKLTGPEAITQAQGGASALPNLQRVIEGSVEGRASTAPFFSARPAQVDTAVGKVLDQIAPQSDAPSTLGPRVADAATNELDSVRQDINDRTRPLYQAAEPQLVPEEQFAAIKSDPRFQTGLQRLRENPDLAPDYEAMPDNSVAVIDAVTKDMAARGESLANSSNPLYGPELAGKNAAGAANARGAAREAVPEYDQALSEQARLRNDTLRPLEEGPVGQVAAAKDTAGAGGALLPQNPMVGSEKELGDAARRLSAQDPDGTAALVRQVMGDRYARAATETQEGSREFAGAKFYKDAAGNAPRRAALDSVVGNLPGGDGAVRDLGDLLDVLQATGRRKAIGSATEFNRALNADLGTASPLGRSIDLAKTLGTSFVTNAGDTVKRAAYRNSIRTLADMMTDPQAVELIREAIARGGPSVAPEVAARTAAQTAPIMTGPRDGRK